MHLAEIEPWFHNNKRVYLQWLPTNAKPIAPQIPKLSNIGSQMTLAVTHKPSSFFQFKTEITSA